MGTGIKYRILNQNRRISPYIKLEMACQIIRNGTIKDTIYYYRGPRIPYPFLTNYGSLFNKIGFMGYVYIGVDFKIVENFYANLNFGYEYRSIEFKREYPYVGDPKWADHYPEFYSIPIAGISAQIIPSYAIPVLKQKPY